MIRISKQEEKRSLSPRRCRFPSPKTGPLKDKLPLGYKEHANGFQGEKNTTIFIAKVK
jgi:hypothetical protein